MSNTVSYVVPYRGGDPARRANLAAVLAWLSTQDIGEVIVVEQDEAPTLGDVPPAPGQRNIFTYGPGPFNKSWAMNVGARMSRGSLLAFGDGDVLSRGLPMAIDAVRRGVPVLRAFDDFRDLDEDDSDLLREDLSCLSDPSFAAAAASRPSVGEHPPACCGIVVMQRRIFTLVAGWDERFLGWGGEDDAMDVKLMRAGIRPGTVAGARGLHLHHRRSAGADGERLYRNNLALLQQLRAMPETSLRRMCEVSLQLIGNPDMYRPLEPLE